MYLDKITRYSVTLIQCLCQLGAYFSQLSACLQINEQIKTYKVKFKLKINKYSTKSFYKKKDSFQLTLIFSIVIYANQQSHLLKFLYQQLTTMYKLLNKLFYIFL